MSYGHEKEGTGVPYIEGRNVTQRLVNGAGDLQRPLMMAGMVVLWRELQKS